MLTWEILQQPDDTWDVWCQGRVRLGDLDTLDEALAYVHREVGAMDVLVVDRQGVESVETAR